MQITLKSDLPFIHKKGIRTCYLENQRNEAVVIKSGDFKQLLKPKEVEQVLENAGVSAPEMVLRPKPATQNVSAPAPKTEEGKTAVKSIEVGSVVTWEGRGGKVRGEVIELIENGARARVKSDKEDKNYKISVKNLSLAS